MPWERKILWYMLCNTGSEASLVSALQEAAGLGEEADMDMAGHQQMADMAGNKRNV